MEVKERRPYCSLTKGRREKERRHTNASADSEECRVPTQKSYSSSETLKAFDHDSSRLLYGNRVKDLVHREADEFSRQGRCLSASKACSGAGGGRWAPERSPVPLTVMWLYSEVAVLSSD